MNPGRQILIPCVKPMLLNGRLKLVGNVQMLSQTRDAGFSKQNYYEKIDKNHRKNIKIAKHYQQGGQFEKK